MADKPTPSSTKRTTGSRGASSRSGSSRSSGNGSKRTTAASRSAAASKAAKARTSSGSGSRSARNGSSRSPSRSSSNGTRSSQTRASANGKSPGVADTLKDAATKAKGPAVAVGAAAAGLAGGLVLKGRMGRRKILGVPMPRSLGSGLPDLDMKSVAKSVGHASKRFAKSSKSVSKDLERAGDQAERIGKILG
jgi:hypothetical protein